MLAGVGTLIDVKQRWTLDELMDAHDVLDAKAEAEAQQVQQMRSAR